MQSSIWWIRIWFGAVRRWYVGLIDFCVFFCEFFLFQYFFSQESSLISDSTSLGHIQWSFGNCKTVDWERSRLKCSGCAYFITIEKCWILSSDAFFTWWVENIGKEECKIVLLLVTLIYFVSCYCFPHFYFNDTVCKWRVNKFNSLAGF